MTPDNVRIRGVTHARRGNNAHLTPCGLRYHAKPWMPDRLATTLGFPNRGELTTNDVDCMACITTRTPCRT